LHFVAFHKENATVTAALATALTIRWNHPLNV
jgi:hypothetical protein